jgi:fatty acid desaturase
MTLSWCTAKDFIQAKEFQRDDLLKTQNTTYGKLLTNIIITKLLYFPIILGLPFMFSALPWYGTLIGFFVMHFIAGVILAAIFQPAHVVPTSTYPVPNDSGVVEADWAVNQLYNTANFAPKAALFSWYVGGLNFQVEHHLFPTISHVHYKKLSEIVKQTAHEYNLPYYSYKTFFGAIKEHTKMLKDLGTKDFIQAKEFQRDDLLKTQNTTYGKLLTNIIITKILYFPIILGLPFMFSALPWYGTLIGFFVMHFIAGVILAAIFQPAHVVPTSTYPVPNDSGVVEADWAVNQLYNTANFAPKAALFSWYVGGLNYQVEHHLFPTISHVHYKKLSEIVRKTAHEYNLPYYSYKTFFGAVKEHTKMLKELGTKDFAPAIHH